MLIDRVAGWETPERYVFSMIPQMELSVADRSARPRRDGRVIRDRVAGHRGRAKDGPRTEAARTRTGCYK